MLPPRGEGRRRTSGCTGAGGVTRLGSDDHQGESLRCQEGAEPNEAHWGRSQWDDGTGMTIFPSDPTSPPTPSPLRAEDSLTSPRRGERASSVARSVRRERRRGLCGTFSRFASFDQMAQIWHFDEFVITPLFDLVRRRLFVVSPPASRVVATSGRCPFFSPMSFKSSGRKKRREKKKDLFFHIHRKSTF